MSIPTLAGLRHRIDVITPELPDSLSRTEVATLMMSYQLQGMSIAIQMIENELGSHPGSRKAVFDLESMAAELIHSLGGQWSEW